MEKNIFLERVKAFRHCGRNVQQLMLENGGWALLNRWMRIGIASHDAAFIKQVLHALLEMPTGRNDVFKQRGGVILTVENFMKRVIGGTVVQYNEEEVNTLKDLAGKVFQRWENLKKDGWMEAKETFNRTEFEVEGGGKGALVQLEGRPGLGMMAVGGRIEVVKIHSEGNTVEEEKCKDKGLIWLAPESSWREEDEEM